MTKTLSVDLPGTPGIQAAMAHLREQYPGFEIVVSDGEVPDEAPAEVKEAIQQMLAELRRKHLASLMLGTCLDCGKKMPKYVNVQQILVEDVCVPFKPHDGWSAVYDVEGGVIGWQCPECNPKADSKLTMIDARSGDKFIFDQQTGEQLQQ